MVTMRERMYNLAYRSRELAGRYMPGTPEHLFYVQNETFYLNEAARIERNGHGKQQGPS